jgi:hypothetical protein
MSGLERAGFPKRREVAKISIRGMKIKVAEGRERMPGLRFPSF